MPAWEYAALLFGEPREVFTTPAAMLLWAEWAVIMREVEERLSEPVEHTSETF